MIDIHSHILPKMDDGSRSVEMSVEMLKESYNQGIDVICATSHFYPSKESPERFIERRKESFLKLAPYLTKEMPIIRLGAEVQYFEGITNVELLPRLRIQGSNLLLIEMPFSKWSERMIKDVLYLKKALKYSIILAHIERYLEYNDIVMFEELSKQGIILQMNASIFTDFFKKSKAIHLLDSGVVKLLGSDCHNMDSRKPNLTEAYKVIEKKLGKEKLLKMNEYAHSLFMQ